MIGDKICVRLLSNSLTTKVVNWPIEDIEYVEQLVFNILESEGVGPLYRSIFGLSLIGRKIWLAPNTPIKSIYSWTKSSSKHQDDAKVELRIRFRPSCYNRLLYEDKIAFDYLFAQIRHDFMRTKFNDEKRDFVLLNDAVLGLVTLDLIRHSIVNQIDIKQILKQVNKDDFLPKRASKWQRYLLFRIAEQINLKKSLQIGLERCDSDPDKVKKEFIELFFLDVAQDYGSEIYNVSCKFEKLTNIIPNLNQNSSSSSSSTKSQLSASQLNSKEEQYEIRVRYHQQGSYANRDQVFQVSDEFVHITQNKHDINSSSSNNNNEESYCVVEIRFKSKNYHNKSIVCNSNGNVSHFITGKQRPWYTICDIETISHATLRKDIVQIARLNGCPLKFKFDTNWHAESFLSYIDGYHRLMRKWNFNLCREVFSPDLNYLKKIRCHGPIGYETTKLKLTHLKCSGTFLLRRCMKKWDRYFIDTILPAKTRLTIDIDHDKVGRFYKKVGFTCERLLNIEVETGQEQYPCLKSLINDIEIRVRYDKDREPFKQQLKHWLQPEEDEDYPALLLAISRRKLRQFERDEEIRANESMYNLPRIIHPNMLEISGTKFTQSNNGMISRLATFNSGQDVVLKDHVSQDDMENRLFDFKSPYTFHCCPKEHNETQFSTCLKPEQLRLTDWLFVKSPLFAETIGYMLNGNSLIQEYFPFGSLDHYLTHNSNISDVTKFSISFQLAQALLYLQEKKVIHGKIRCHNIFVSRAYPIHIKLSDPLGMLDLELDQAFIPPEYFKMAIQICIKEFYTGIDVWAFGTTLWQVFNRGARPPSGRYANTLLKPGECPNDVWKIIEACWNVDPCDRPSPQILYRDLNDLFAWEKGAHDYFYISQEIINNNDYNNQVQAKQRPNSSSPHNNNNNNNNTTANSSLADLSSINSNTNCSFTPIVRRDLEDQDNSQALLLRSLTESTNAIGNDSDTLSMNSSLTITTENGLGAPPLPPPRSLSGQNSNDPRCQNNYHNRQQQQQNQLRKNYKSKLPIPWRNILNLREGTSLFALMKWSDGPRNQDENLPPDVDFSRLSSSKSSLSSCTTPSEATGLTDLPEIENLSVAFERCFWNVESSRLKLGAEIGRGTSGIVVKGVLFDQDIRNEQVVAVKCLDRDHSNFNLHRMNDLRREFDIMKDLRHKNIVRVLGFVEDTCMKLIFEYMPLGSLKSCIKNLSHDSLKELPLQKYAHDIACGMNYLESMKIVHRDLALRNILLKSRNEVKICDFGLAQFLNSEDHYRFKTPRALPLKWYSPETLSTYMFTHKSDVWSYGVVLWEIYSGGDSPHYPGALRDLAETLKHERLKRPKGCPYEIYNLMLRCWAYNPDERITFAQLSDELC